MFEIPAFAAAPFWYVGLIVALFFGWAASSYASNFSYRLPRSETPFGREPYCGDCDAKLTPRDLFPIFSWLFTRGKCRHCGASVPASYMLFELFYTLYLAVCYIAFGFGDMFVVMGAVGMLLQISVMMAWDDEYLSPPIIQLLLALGIIYRILIGETLLDGLLASFFGLFSALALTTLLTRKKLTKDVYALPKWVWLFMATGAWLTPPHLLLFIALLAGFTVLLGAVTQKIFTARLTIAHAIALLVSLWWPLLSG